MWESFIKITSNPNSFSRWKRKGVILSLICLVPKQGLPCGPSDKGFEYLLMLKSYFLNVIVNCRQRLFRSASASVKQTFLGTCFFQKRVETLSNLEEAWIASKVFNNKYLPNFSFLIKYFFNQKKQISKTSNHIEIWRYRATVKVLNFAAMNLYEFLEFEIIST